MKPRTLVPAAPADVLRFGSERLRVGTWHGHSHIALITTLPDQSPPSARAISGVVDVLAGRGFTTVLTGALTEAEQDGFLAAGFTVRERLHLLTHDLSDIPDDPPHPRLRRARRADLAAVLALDHASFEEFWQLDDTGLDEALLATPATRFRLAVERRPIGYAVCGRAGRRGYLQRLAVDPEHQGRGVGGALVADGLRWMRRRHVSHVMVNTQVGNAPALRLYERTGFTHEPAGLAVLCRELGDDRRP